MFQAQYRVQFQQEQRRTMDAELAVKGLSNKNEERVATLETKVSELSDSVGEYERFRFQDQQTIQKLKDRLLQLDMENTVLAQTAHVKSDDDASDQKSGDSLDAQALATKIVKLKGQLKLANQKAANPVEIDGRFTERITTHVYIFLDKYLNHIT